MMTNTFRKIETTVGNTVIVVAENATHFKFMDQLLVTSYLGETDSDGILIIDDVKGHQVYIGRRPHEKVWLCTKDLMVFDPIGETQIMAINTMSLFIQFMNEASADLEQLTDKIRKRAISKRK